MITETKYHVEGLNPEGEWHMLDRPVEYDADPRAHRDNVVRMLRKMGITRYTRVRLAKYVTTIEIVGEDITV